ncbi:MAG TPA: hypothetical protein VGN26_03290, partial [Armatimonadota bacterium]
TQQNAANAEESASASEEMASQSQEMLSMVGSFELSHAGASGPALKRPKTSPRAPKLRQMGRPQVRALSGPPSAESLIPLDGDEGDVLASF